MFTGKAADTGEQPPGVLAKLILPKLFATETFFVFPIVQFMRGLPRELEEAARINGCGPFRSFFLVIL